MSSNRGLKNEWKRAKRKALKTLEELMEDDPDTIHQSIATLPEKRPALGSAVFEQTVDSHKYGPEVIDGVLNSVSIDQNLLNTDKEPVTEVIESLTPPTIKHIVESESDQRFEEEIGFDECDSSHNDVGVPFTSEELHSLRALLEEDPDHDSALRSDLVVWALEFKIGRNALTSLLHILRKHNHPDLPLSSKTLLKTPRSTVQMFKTLGDGLFWYYGILVNLTCRLSESFLGKLNGNNIVIDVFVDGVSPYKSVKTVLWPICGSIAGLKDIFIIGMWCGKSKEPGSLALFLEDFISEANHLMAGFTHLGYKLKLKIRNIIADAPARTWLKNVNQHGSYNACERCSAVGQWLFNRMTYHPREETLLRTDKSLQEQVDKSYHKGPTPLVNLKNFALIGQMPLEPMHLLSLGVMKRILLQLLGTKRNSCEYKFSDSLKIKIDTLSEYISQFYPPDFARKPRKWTEFALFKAAELRRIMLYDGFLLLKAEGVSKKVYNNFRLLACAVRILSDPLLIKEYIDDADMLLKKFITDSVLVYKQQFNVYNVHHLKHLAEECRRHGDLESFSAFKYENHLGVLKRLLHAPGRTLPQIVCRLLEQVTNRPELEVESGISVSMPCALPMSLAHLGKGYKTISIPEKSITLSRHSHFLSVDKEIIQMCNIIKTEESYILVGRKFQRQSDYFNTPVPSSCLDIYEVNKLGATQNFTLNQVFKKCVVVPIPSERSYPTSTFEGPCLAMSMPHGGD